jgi:hypothetical protein
MSPRNSFASAVAVAIAATGCNSPMGQLAEDGPDAASDLEPTPTVDAAPVPTAPTEVLGYGTVVYAKAGQRVRRQMVISDAVTLAQRECPLDPDTGVVLDACEAWSYHDLQNLIGDGNESYGGIATYAVDVEGATVIRTIFLEANGYTGWGRECPVDPMTGIVEEECGPWNEVTLGGVANQSVGYVAYSASVLQIGEQPIRRQILIKEGGNLAYGRECRLDPVTAEADCDAFGEIDLSHALGEGGETYRAYAAYVFQRGGESQRRQILVRADTGAIWGRECPVTDVGTGSEICTAWSEVDLDY